MTLEQTARSRMVTGLFPDRATAERAYSDVSARGYGQDDVNLVMSDETRKRHFNDDTMQTELGTKAAEGAGIGGAIGGSLGAIAVRIAAVRTPSALARLGRVVALPPPAWAPSPRPSPGPAPRSPCPGSASSSPARWRRRSPVRAPAQRPAGSS